MSISDTPHAGIGDNIPDYAKEEMGRLDREMAHIKKQVAEFIGRLDEMPKAVTNDEEQGIVDGYIVDARDLVKKTLEPLRVGEKAQYLAKERAVDQWFKLLGETITNAIGPIRASADEYQLAKAAREKAAREEEERQRRAAEEAAIKARQKAEEEAREAAANAARKRNAEARAIAEAEAKTKADAAAAARANERVAMQQTDEAVSKAGESSADMSRTRHTTGRMTTTAQVPDVRILDRVALDLEILRPYFKDDHLQNALNDYAKKTNYRGECAGAYIGKKDAVVRR